MFVISFELDIIIDPLIIMVLLPLIAATLFAKIPPLFDTKQVFLYFDINGIKCDTLEEAERGH